MQNANDIIRSTLKSIKMPFWRTLFPGISSSLLGGAVYGYMVFIDPRYFTPALGIVAGLIGGLGIAARDILSEKEDFKDMQIKDIMTYVLFGITGLILGLIFVYYFVKFPFPSHGGLILLSSNEIMTILDFFTKTMPVYDMIGAILGSVISLSIPVLFKNKIKKLIKRPLKVSG